MYVNITRGFGLCRVGGDSSCGSLGGAFARRVCSAVSYSPWSLRGREAKKSTDYVCSLITSNDVSPHQGRNPELKVAQ